MVAVARVHYEIPDELHRRAKAAAAIRGVSLKDFIIEALTQAVDRSPDPDPPTK